MKRMIYEFSELYMNFPYYIENQLNKNIIILP